MNPVGGHPIPDEEHAREMPELEMAARVADDAAEEALRDEVVQSSEQRTLAKPADSDYQRAIDDIAFLVAMRRDVLRSAAGDDAGELDAPVRGDALGVWGPFELIERLGGGASGEVYKVRDRHLKNHVALKLFHEERVASVELDTLLVEGRQHALLKHPNIAVIHGADENDGRVGIWMEYLDGATLQELVETQGTFGAAEAVIIARKLCSALAAVHQQGLTHGDIKAQNVMREKGGRIVLMDFSSSRHVEVDDESSGLVGTPIYMAPELFDDKPSDFRSDIYALGVLLFYLVTGRHPYEAQSLKGLEETVRMRRPLLLDDLRQDLPSGLVRAVQIAISWNPADRFQSAGEFQTALRDAVAAEPLESLPPPYVREVARLARVALWCGVSLAILVALGFTTSTALNAALGRSSEYAPESLVQWAIWGLRSLIGPMYHLVKNGFYFFVLYAAIRLLWKLAWVRQGLSSPRDRVAKVAQRLGLDDPKLLANVGTVVGSVLLAVLVWRYTDLIGAVYALRETPIERSTIAMLSPDNILYHLDYRANFTFLVTSLILTAMGIRRYAKWRSQPSSLAGIGAVLVVALVLLEFPWQILFQAKFPQVIAGGETCYEVGASKQEDSLLFCPLSIHKTRVVPREPRDYERTGVIESVFTLDAPSS